jgi:hypothetical protein
MVDTPVAAEEGKPVVGVVEAGRSVEGDTPVAEGDMLVVSEEDMVAVGVVEAGRPVSPVEGDMPVAEGDMPVVGADTPAAAEADRLVHWQSAQTQPRKKDTRLEGKPNVLVVLAGAVPVKQVQRVVSLVSAVPRPPLPQV